MTKTQLLQYSLTKKDAYLEYPFALNDYAVVKIKNQKNGKSAIFSELFALKGEEMLTFSTEAELAEILRSNYPNIIIRGWHCPQPQAKFKSSVCIKCLDDDMLKKLVDTSYDYVKVKLKID